MKILSIKYANAEGTAAVLQTKEHGAVLIGKGEKNVAGLEDSWSLLTNWATTNPIDPYVPPIEIAIHDRERTADEAKILLINNILADIVLIKEKLGL